LRRAGLDEILLSVDTETAAPKHADGTGSDCLTQPERIANYYHKITHPRRYRIRDFGGR
jgi:hypothetical protein